MMKTGTQRRIGQRAEGKKQEVSFVVSAVLCSLSFMIFASFLFFAPSVACSQPAGLSDKIKKAVLAELVSHVSQNVELREVRYLKGFDALDNGKSYAVGNISMDDYNGPNRIVYLASLYDGEKTVRKVLVEASFDILASVFVAARPLVSGTVITKADVYSVKQKNSRLPSGAITEISGIEGKTLKSNVAEGAILRTGYLTSSSGIKKGREVLVLVEGENVLISTKGVLSNDATIGGIARVLCSAPRKEIVGILVSSDTVKVKI